MTARPGRDVGSLRLHRAPRADLLIDALADVLRVPQADPFARELVIVPAKGVERWVSQRLSHALGTGATGGRYDDGVCAGVDFRAPRSIVAEVVGLDVDDPWSPDTVVWPLLEVIDASLGQAWCPALTRHLGQSGVHGDDVRRGRRWAVAHRLARLFASYAAQRPSMLIDWEAGADTDGAAQPVDADLAWQPELWRRLVAHVAQPSPVVRHHAAVRRLAADPDASDLPPRLSLLGHTRLTVTEVDLLRALAEHRQVDIWLPHASDALWQALRDPTSTGPMARRDDSTHLAALHPLLATLGRDVRELQRTVTPIAATSVALDIPSPRPPTLLGRLQSDIEANRVPAGDHCVDPADRSVQVHACHGAARQVEVLREVVLGLLADDPTLEPRDIVVMCPDIERFAPLVEAAFGLGGVSSSTDGWHPGQQLQVRLADRSLVQTNPLLGVIGRLLDLAGSRAPASTILDLAATKPVRRRFGFTDDDLDTMTRWVDETGVRWAFDDAHRAPYGLAAYVQNTWQFGLDRMLAGAAVSHDAHRYFGPTLPYDAVGSSGIDLVGRLTELVERLRSITDRLTGTASVAGWVDTLRTAVASLTDVGWGDEWQVHQTERELAAIGAEQADAAIELSLTDIRSLMAARLVGRPTRANFRTGSLTVCTMVPMRSVPHRVVCLLGVD
ncbi:MAG: exodeoxyribonuclease V subunit gamma, partial [Aeromicrobium sp.]